MTKPFEFSSPSPRNDEKGISLIIVLIMMVVIGLTAAAAMRNATSSQRATNNARVESLALQYAEAALRYCEGQLQLASTARVNSLKDAVIPTSTFTVSAWEQTISWTGIAGSGGASSTRTSPPAAQYSTAGVSSNVPTRAPECIAELQTLGSPTFTATVVTARGFSPDYAADATTGQTTRGAVVWLQSILNL